MVDSGFIIIVASGNENRNSCNNYHYSSYPGVISIGGINNYQIETYGDMELMYERAYFSNFGSCVDIFAPTTIRITNYPSNELKTWDAGTSFSAPLVSGVVATIMSENSSTNYNYKTMRQKLIDLSVKNVINGLDSETPNRLLNNGKKLISHSPRCDDSSDSYKCLDGCCSKFGQCVDSSSTDEKMAYFCLIENQCSPEFGYCYSKKYTMSTKLVYIQNVNNKGCLYAHKTETYKLRYSSTCNKNDLAYLWEIPESGNGIWRNVGTNYYVTISGDSLITTADKSKAIIMGDMTKSVVANSVWYANYDYKNLCSIDNSGKIYLQQCDTNNKNQRWVTIDKDPVTTTTYTSLKFKGSLSYDDTLYLSVPKYGLIDTYDMSITDKYYSWFVTSTTKPSFLYLSDGASGSVGKPSNYCLDLSTRVNNDSDRFNYLRIVKCTEANYKFKFNGSYKNGEINSISVYTSKDKPYSINNNDICLYYSMSPRVINCNNTSKASQINWKILEIKSYNN